MKANLLGVGCSLGFILLLAGICRAGPANVPAGADDGGASAADSTVDLLAGVEFPHDRVTGVWRSVADGIEGIGAVRLKSPPAEEYDYHVEFARRNGRGAVAFILSHDGTSFEWVMGTAGNTASGFEEIDGHDASDNPTTVRGEITNGKRYDVVIKVRNDSLSAWVNGEQWSALKTDYSNLTPARHGYGGSELRLASNSRTIFYAADVMTLGGNAADAVAIPGKSMDATATGDSGIIAPAENEDGAPADNGPIQVQPADFRGSLGLDQVHLADDVVEGNWTSTAHGIESDGDEGGRFYLPYLPSGQYDYYMTFTRVSGDGAVRQILSYNGHSFAWVMGGDGNRAMGFEMIQGRSAEDNQSTVRMAAALTNGRTYHALVQVRRTYVAGYLDGRLISRVNVNYGEMNLNPGLDLGGPALGAGSDSRVVISSIKAVSVDEGYWLNVGGGYGWPYWHDGRWWYHHHYWSDWRHRRFEERVMNERERAHALHEEAMARRGHGRDSEETDAEGSGGSAESEKGAAVDRDSSQERTVGQRDNTAHEPAARPAPAPPVRVVRPLPQAPVKIVPAAIP